MKLGLFALIIGVLLLAGCTTASPAAASPGAPKYHEFSFTLRIPQDPRIYSIGQVVSDFPIYLTEDQTLHLHFWQEEEGNGIWFSFVTPGGEHVGLTASGHLSECSCCQLVRGSIVFSPSQYGWGEGYYLMEPHINVCDREYAKGAEAHIELRYWIEEYVRH